MDQLLAAESAMGSEQWAVVAPPAADDAGLELKALKVMKGGRGSGHSWEQVFLPRLARDGVLLNLANSGPVVHRRSCVVIHDAVVYRLPTHFSRAYRTLHQTLGRILARTATLATVSKFSQGELSEVLRVPADRITIVPNGCDHIRRVKADPRVLERLGLKQRKYFLFVGSPAPHKNLEAAIDAFGRAGLCDFKLVLCGAVKREVFGAGQAELPHGVISAHDLDDSEIAGLYQGATAFVFPTKYEGFGIPPLEAMVHGCPVLASDIAPCREVCGPAGRYFSPDDHEALAGLMVEHAVSPEAREAVIDVGFERQALFRWRHSAGRMITLARTLGGVDKR